MTTQQQCNGASVVIPVYNREQYLEECINSVKAQECDFPVEIILADDGSTDKSKEIALSFGSSVRWLDKPADCSTQGAGPTRNRGIQAAAYPLIAFLDSDDVFLPGHLHRLFHFLAEHPEYGAAVDQLYGFSQSLEKIWIMPYSDKETVKLESFFLNPYFNPSVSMLRQSVINELDIPFEPALRFAQDIDFFFRILEKHPIAILAEAGACLREHNKRSTGGGSWKIQYEYAWMVLQRAVQRYPYPAWLVRKRKAAIAFRLAQGDIAGKKYFSAVCRLLYAGLLDPLRAAKILMQKH
ncbi:MAG: glycosyltransferase family 2 protein [Planctomycetaceae bacterium]|nr:glycosyltransferase family 2 protein [Planctomycetaceae bacterium]